jgi:predicted alpha/beta hydrolase family esterase
MIVIVYGYEGSGPGHWQHWLFDQLRQQGAPVLFPELPDNTEPKCDAWVAALRGVLDEVKGEVTFAAHSLGCWAIDHYLARHGAGKVRGALLVAPPSPYSLFEPIQSFLPPPRSKAAWAPLSKSSLLLGSDNDDYVGDDEVVELSRTIDVPHRILPGTGHINAAAGFGPFPLALDWLRESGAL